VLPAPTTDKGFSTSDIFELGTNVGSFDFETLQPIPDPPETVATRERAHEIEDPDHVHLLNMDCVSCHTSTQRIIGLQVKDTPQRFRAADGITAYARNSFVTSRGQLQNSLWNLRNFGYVDDFPTVSQRTVNETAAIVAFINKDILHRDNPGRRCAAADQGGDVWKCVNEMGVNCFERCGEASGGNPPEDPDDPELPALKNIEQCKGPLGGADDGVPGTVERAGRKITITLSKTDARCLSKVLAGRHVSKGLDIVCDRVDSCRIIMQGKTKKLADGASEKLFNQLRFVSFPDKSKEFRTSVSPTISIFCPLEKAVPKCNVALEE
jgi:hypothetical protein